MSKYGTTPEQYKEIFARKAKEQIELLQELERICHDAGVDLKDFTDRFIWNFFQDIIYDTDDEARITQKKNDPEGYKESEGYLGDVLGPTKQELMDEIKSVNAKVEALTDYLSESLKKENHEIKSLKELFEFKFGKMWHPEDQA